MNNEDWLGWVLLGAVRRTGPLSSEALRAIDELALELVKRQWLRALFQMTKETP